MSNLFKYNTVQCGEDKKIIDYNELIEEKLSKIRYITKEEDQEESNEFKAGLFAREVAITEEEIIEEEPLSPELLLEEAREEANRILEQAKMEAEQLKEAAYQEGSKVGYEEGYQQGLADIEEEKKLLSLEKANLQNEYEIQMEEMETVLVEAITTVVQNVFKIKFEDNRNIIVHLIKIALGRIENSNVFYVKVSKGDYPYVLKYKEVLEKTVVKASSIEIMEDASLAKNQCLIETDGGVFDCSLDVQLDNLTKTLKILSHN